MTKNKIIFVLIFAILSFFLGKYLMNIQSDKTVSTILYGNTDNKCVGYMLTDEYDFDVLNYPNDTIVIGKITKNNDCNYYSDKVKDPIFTISGAVIDEAIKGWAKVQYGEISNNNTVGLPDSIKSNIIKNKEIILKDDIENKTISE